jgi:hypothetical protein
MSRSEAELTLVMKAQNLASGAVDAVHTSLDRLATKAAGVTTAVGTAFGNMARSVAAGIGNVGQSIIQGGDLVTAFEQVAVMAAGAFVESLIIQLIEKLAATTFIQGIAATLGAAGASIGGVIAAAVPIGMAALPFLLVAAIVGAIAFLITHPEVLRTIADVAGSIVHHLIAGLAGLAGMILGAIVAAPGAIANVVGGFAARSSPGCSGSRGDCSTSASRSCRRSSAAWRRCPASC